MKSIGPGFPRSVAQVTGFGRAASNNSGLPQTNLGGAERCRPSFTQLPTPYAHRDSTGRIQAFAVYTPSHQCTYEKGACIVFVGAFTFFRGLGYPRCSQQSLKGQPSPRWKIEPRANTSSAADMAALERGFRV